jgi:SAM-dependent methyltransferase
MRVQSARLGALAGAAGTAGEAIRAGVETIAPGMSRCSAPGARSYDATFGRMLATLYREVARDMRRAVSGPGHRHIVDVGAGPGGLAVELAGMFPLDRVTAVDIDPAMVALARARVAREGLAERVAVLVGDVAALPLRAASVDLVTSSFSAHHWPDAPAGFAEIRRVLRPGGRAIVYDLPDWWGRFETHAPPLDLAARAGGFAEARTGHLRWPGPVRLVRRLDLTR